MGMKNSGRTLSAVLFIVAALLLATSGVRMIAAYRDNELNVYSHPKLNADFRFSEEWNPYVARVDTHCVEAIRWYNAFLKETGNTNIRTLVDIGPYLSAPELVLEQPVTYYKKEAGRYTVVAKYPAGTKIQLLYFAGDRPYLDIGHGTTSLPTLEAGWRLAAPFAIVENGVRQDAKVQELGLCYVRLDDLTAVVDQTLKADLNVWRQCYTLNGVVSADTPVEELARRMLLYMDAELYQEGIYRSQDIYHPYFDATNIVLLSAAGVLLTLHIVLRVRKAKESL